MNVDSSNTATAIINTTNVPNNATGKTVSKSKSNSDFDNELKTVSKSEEKTTDKTDDAKKETTNTESKTEETSKQEQTSNSQDSNNTNNETNENDEQQNSQQQNQQNNNADLSQENQKLLIGGIDTKNILTQNIQELVNTKSQIEIQMLKGNTPVSLDYQTIEMSDDDAMFFVNLVNNTDMTMQNIAGQIQNDIQNNIEGIEQKTKISVALINTIKEGIKTNQPFRIDFGPDVAVVLKLDKDGNVSANFIPGDKAVEQYLKNNIGYLKQRFDDENLSYKNLSYSQSKNQNQERNQEKKNKEKE